MIDIRLNHQGNVFQNASDIVPTPDIISFLLNAFEDKALVPNTFQQLSPNQPVRTRLQLTSTNGEWQINFTTRRIDISKNPTDRRGTNLGDIQGFCEDIIDFQRRIQSRFRRRANRLALVSSVLLEEMSPQTLSDVYARLLHPTGFYQEHQPFEWNWRSAAHLEFELDENIQETLNVITIIRRLRGRLDAENLVQPYERIQMSWEINTIAENSEYRFELDHIVRFYQEIPGVFTTLMQQTLEFIDE